MKFIKPILILSLLLFTIGCGETKETKKEDAPVVYVVNEKPTKFCSMTATKMQREEYLMLDHLITNQPIACNTDDDCYQYFLDNDDYRSLTPDFEPYLYCESHKFIEIISK